MSQRQYVSTIGTTNDHTVAVRSNQTNINIELGQARDVGHSAYIRSTYAARYNFAVQQYNHYETDSSETKRNMRGGRFFLYNFIIFVFFIGSTVCAMAAANNKPLNAVPFIVSAIYLLITCYNWHIHRINGSLIHENMVRVADRTIPDSINKHFTIPVHARIENREIIAASDGSTTAVLARLQQQNHDLTEIDIMLYDSTYATRYAAFPKETILHFFLFSSVVITTVILMINN